MKTLMTICATAIALAIPASALAHDGNGHGGKDFRGHHHGNAGLVKLAGTGTSFGSATATASGTATSKDSPATGTFAASITTNWAASQTKTFDKGALSCAPATATLTVTGATTTNTLSSSLTGKTCAFTKTDGTIVRSFFGNGTVTGAGALASLTGKIGKAFLFQKADGTVSGAVFAGRHEGEGFRTFAVREHDAAHKTGDCDHQKS